MAAAEAVHIPTAAGHHLSGTLFRPERSTIGRSILISSATGVLQKFYFPFARHFASLGYRVLTFDYWGIGDSGGDTHSLRKNTFDLEHWGNNDLTAATQYLCELSPDSELTVVTHSIGGQLVGLNRAFENIDKMVLVASQSGYWKFYRGWHKLKMWAFWHLMIPGLTPFFGYFPSGDLGLFENLPKNMACQWMRWGRNPGYMMGDVPGENRYYHQIAVPMLSLSFPGDELAPPEAVDWLNEQYRAARVTRIHYTAEGFKPGHFGFFREAFSDTLWARTHRWITTEQWENG